MLYVYIYLARRHIKYICTQHKTIQIYTENEINPEIKMMNELILHSLQWQIIPHKITCRYIINHTVQQVELALIGHFTQ